MTQDGKDALWPQTNTQTLTKQVSDFTLKWEGREGQDGMVMSDGMMGKPS